MGRAIHHVESPTTFLLGSYPNFRRSFRSIPGCFRVSLARLDANLRVWSYILVGMARRWSMNDVEVRQ
jgi:hypothetical protein